MRTVAYLRVSTGGQDLEKNKADILSFANTNRLGTVEFIEEKVSGTISWKQRKLKDLIDGLNAGDNLIVSELSRIGRSMLEVMEVLSIVKDKEINIYAVKGQWKLDDSLQSRILAMAFSIAAEVEREMISERTSEALRAARSRGVRLGRPRGKGKSKLDQYEDEIVAMLRNGSTQAFIAKKYEISSGTLSNWLKRKNLNRFGEKDKKSA